MPEFEKLQVIEPRGRRTHERLSHEAGKDGGDHRRRHAEDRPRRDSSPSAGNRRLSSSSSTPSSSTASTRSSACPASRSPISRASCRRAGLRVISFRHEQNAGYAASIAGFMTGKPGICLTVSAPGFLNGLTALANATTNCFPMILISGSSEREIVDLQQGDYEEMDQLAIAEAARQGRVPRPARRGHRRRRGARDPGSGLRPARRRLSRPAGQAVPADDRRGSREEVADQGRRSGAAPDSGAGRREARARPPARAPSVR